MKRQDFEDRKEALTPVTDSNRFKEVVGAVARIRERGDITVASGHHSHSIVAGGLLEIS